MRNFAEINIIASVIKAVFQPTKRGFPILNVTVAGNAPSRDGSKAIAFYHQVQILGKYAEALKPIVTPGQVVAVTGRLSQDRWETEAGKKSTVRIIADSFNILAGNYETVADAKGQERLMSGRN